MLLDPSKELPKPIRVVSTPVNKVVYRIFTCKSKLLIIITLHISWFHGSLISN